VSRLAWAISGILGLGLIATTLDNRRLRGVLADLRQQQRSTPTAPEVASLGPHGEVHPPPSAPTPQAAQPQRPPPAKAPVAQQVEDAVQARLAAQHAERVRRMQAQAADAVDDFADDAELSNDEREAMHDILRDTLTELVDAWEHHADDVGGEAMQVEVAEIRDELDDALVELLGEDSADAFQATFGPVSWQR
jgi:hypothetical protein